MCGFYITNQFKILHMPWQLSCLAICIIMAKLYTHRRYQNKDKTIFIRFQLWARKPPVKLAQWIIRYFMPYHFRQQSKCMVVLKNVFPTYQRKIIRDNIHWEKATISYTDLNNLFIFKIYVSALLDFYLEFCGSPTYKLIKVSPPH